jgi:hypothetical protein
VQGRINIAPTSPYDTVHIMGKVIIWTARVRANRPSCYRMLYDQEVRPNMSRGLLCSGGGTHRFRFRWASGRNMRPTSPFRARGSVDSEWGCVVSPSTRAGGGAVSHRPISDTATVIVMRRQRGTSGLRGPIVVGVVPLLWQCFPREHLSGAWVTRFGVPIGCHLT